MSQIGSTGVRGLVERIEAYGRALTAPEIAALFGVTPEAIYKAAKQGSIPSFRINTSVRFDPAKVVEWLAKQGLTNERPKPWTRVVLTPYLTSYKPVKVESALIANAQSSLLSHSPRLG